MHCRCDRRSSGSGFSLIELLVVIAIIALLISILLPALGAARRVARLVICEANMAQLGVGYYSYATDGKGWLAAFSWQPRVAYSQFADLNSANMSSTRATDSHCYQAADIARRVGKYNQPVFTGRMMSRNYTHLVLADGGYLGSDSLPVPAVVCSEDFPALLWQRTPPDQIESLVNQGLAPRDNTASYRQMLPQWSSYQLVPAVWAADSGTERIGQATTDYRLYTFTTATRFKNRRLDDFAFPSQKVVYFDLFDRHMARKWLFHAYPQAKQPLAFGDGSVQVKKTSDSNRGWDPAAPTNLSRVTQYRYRPIDAGDPPALSGAAAGDTVIGWYRWTRWGLRGIDFGGREPTRRP